MSSEVPEIEPGGERRLRERLRRADAPVALSTAEGDALFAALRSDLASERGLAARLRALSTPTRRALGVTAAAVLVSGVALWAPRPDLHAVTFALSQFQAVATGLLALAVVSVAVAVWPVHRPVMAWLRARPLTFVAFAIVFVSTLLPVGDTGSADFVTALRGSVPCLVLGSAAGAVVYAVLRLLDRGMPDGAYAAAAAAAVTANVALVIHCPSGDPRHTVIGHFGAALVLLLGGLVSGRLRRRGPEN